MKKILVAGAGHGGLIVAANLAKKGFDVTVIEQKNRKKLGYDWTDIFDINAFIDAKVPISNQLKLKYTDNMTFYTPNLKCKKRANVPSKERDIKMERKQIYDILIGFAKKSGVKFVYNEKIIKSIISFNRVVGIETSNNKYYGDLIIDACGINSPIRNSLNKDFGVEVQIDNNDQFYVYRAFYSKDKKIIPKDKYKVYLMPRNEKGISWIANDNDYVDILIGRFYPINEKIVNDELLWLKENNEFSLNKIRGGQFVKIPIRRPISQMVYNGYAAIGDSAFMTIPLIGSGLAICAKAAKILTDVLLKKEDTNYNIEDLWEYQANFYKKIGYDLAFKDILKCLFSNFDSEEINFIFENDVINDDMLVEITNEKKLEIKPKEIIEHGKNGISNPKLMIKLADTLLRGKMISRHCKKIPKKYSYKEVEKWKEKYLEIKIAET